MNYLDRLITAFSRFLNTAVGGDQNETLSGRSYRQRDLRHWFICMNLINTLFFWQHSPRHCERIFKLEERFRARLAS